QARDRAGEFVVVETSGARALWFFAVDKELRYPPPRYDAKLERHSEFWRLTLRAEVLLRDVIIAVDRLDPEATISENVVTLLPGQSASFDIRSKRELSVGQLTNVPVMQCANRFGRKT